VTTQRRRLGPRLRGYLIAGILVTAPIAVTLTLALWFVEFIDSQVLPLLPARYNPETWLPFAVPGLGLVLVVVALTLVGMITAGVAGRFVVGAGEGLLDRMPGVRGLYRATKQILHAVFAEGSDAFRQAVAIQFPREGLWIVGFVTTPASGEIGDVLEEEAVGVFIPTMPNPITGFFLTVPRRDVVPLEMTMEEAAMLVISFGIVEPPSTRGEAP
jgi:uncharacterized membrane protein